MKDPAQILQRVNSPRYLFDFAKLVDLFAGEIIPTTQVLMPGSHLALFFNPADLTLLGLD